MAAKAEPLAWSTPACAGNTTAARAPTPRRTEHPRVRGEHFSAAASAIGDFGAPPRARGTRVSEVLEVRRPRSTPACAGNTTGELGRASTAPEHPRVRGEHVTLPVLATDSAGAPPRARGTRVQQFLCQDVGRSTPACAGNTHSSVGCSGPPSEHPRVRGEHQALRSSVRATSGAPPRARGTHIENPTG